MTPLYFDHNAGAPLRPEARDAMLAAMDVVGNPSSVHRFGRAARRIVETAREQVAAIAGVSPAQVVFTSGATEANALALHGDADRRWLAAATDHDSVLAWAAHRLLVGRDGLVNPDRLAAELTGNGCTFAVHAVNGETGVIQPMAEIGSAVRRCGARLHCDAAQAAGKIALDLRGWGAETLSLSSPKIGGPAGVGALVLAQGASPTALLRGGGQERGRRAGTENVVGIAGFGAAAAAALAGLSSYAALALLRDRLERSIRAASPAAMVFGATAPRVANTSCLAMPGVPAETQVAAFDLDGIAVSAGSACSSGTVRPSHVLAAMQAGAAAGCAIRISIGPATTEAEIDRAVASWLRLHARTRDAAAAKAV